MEEIYKEPIEEEKVEEAVEETKEVDNIEQ